MSDHYFEPQPASASQPRVIRAVLRGEEWAFTTDRGVFSPEHIDPATRLLVECLEVPAGARILDLGAGYGPLGLVAARLAGPAASLCCVEVNQRALELCGQNAERAGVAVTLAAEVPAGAEFDVVCCNPPMRAGYKVVMPLIEAGAAALAPGGRFWLVGFKHLGVKTLERKLAELLGEVTTIARKAGYRVLVAGRETPDAGA